MIRVEEGAQKTNAYQENRNLLLSKTAHGELHPRPRDPRQRRALHARRDARAGRPRAALLPDGARALAVGGGAADRARASSRTCSTASSWSRCATPSAPRSRPASRRATTSGGSGKYGTAWPAANASHRVVLGRPHTFRYGGSLRPSAARFSLGQAAPNFPETPLVSRAKIPTGVGFADAAAGVHREPLLASGVAKYHSWPSGSAQP